MIKLEPEYLKIVHQILAEHVPGLEVRAFGSRVHGEKLKPFSDLDLVIMTQNPLPSEEYSALKEAFSESDLPIKVDLLDWSDTSENFRSKILQSYTVIQQPKKGKS